MLGMISLSLLVMVFLIILFPTLHRLIGHIEVIFFGFFTFGVSTKRVSLVPFGRQRLNEENEGQSYRESPHLLARFFGRSRHESLQYLEPYREPCRKAPFYLIFGKRFTDYLFKVLNETRKAIRSSS